MITGSKEYERFLADLADANQGVPSILKMRVPTTEEIYEIDWNTRKISPPPFIGVSGDHRSEYIFFKMDRYYDMIDLSTTIGMVVFKNSKNEEFFQLIPYYDIMTEQGKIYFPWSIQAPAALYSGQISFSFKFFKVDINSKELLYEINTTIAKTKVLNGWSDDSSLDHSYSMVDTSSLIVDSSLINNLNSIISASQYLSLYWIDVDNPIELNRLQMSDGEILEDSIADPENILGN